MKNHLLQSNFSQIEIDFDPTSHISINYIYSLFACLFSDNQWQGAVAYFASKNSQMCDTSFKKH